MEAFEVYTLSYLENYISQHRVNVSRTKLESDEELPIDGDTQPMPIVQINLDDCVVYQRILPALNKPALAKNKFTCFVYINQLSDQFFTALFDAYRLVVQFPECTFVFSIRGVKDAQDFNELQSKFCYCKQFNLFGYKHGLHKVLRGNHKFDDTLFLLENEQNELIEVAQYPFQVYNKIAKEMNDKKPREHVPDIVLDKGAAIVQGQYIKFIQQATEYKDSSRIVVAVFDEQEKDFNNVLHQF